MVQACYSVDGSGSLIRIPVRGSFYPAVPFYHAGRPFSGGKLGRQPWLYCVLGLAGLPSFRGGFWYILQTQLRLIFMIYPGSYVTGKRRKSQGLTFGRILAATFYRLALFMEGMIKLYVNLNLS